MIPKSCVACTVENEAGERLDFGKKEISSVHLTADLDAEMDEDIPPDEE